MTTITQKNTATATGSLSAVLLASLLAFVIQPATAADEPQPPVFKKGDHVVFIGNTFADHLRRYGYFETLLHSYYPQHKLIVRNLGWSGDTPAVQLRPHLFGDMHSHLTRHKADVIFASFGMTESFGGPGGVEQFSKDLSKFLGELKKHKYNGKSHPQIVLISPVAHENLGPPLPDGVQHNENIEFYTRAMQKIASREGIYFVDLFHPTKEIMESKGPHALTTNGVHLNEHGYLVASQILGRSIGLLSGAWQIKGPEALKQSYGSLRQAINAKNKYFFNTWRAVNGEYIYGRRRDRWKFEAEFKELARLLQLADQEIWQQTAKQTGGMWSN